MVNINIPIDSGMHHKLKIQAIRTQKTLKAYIISCLEKKVLDDSLLHKAETGQKRQKGATQ